MNPSFLSKLTCLLRDRYGSTAEGDLDHHDNTVDGVESEPVYADIISLRGRRQSDVSIRVTSRVTSLFCCRVAYASRLMQEY